MLHQFTAAAERALDYASGWTNRTDCDELEAEPLLVGLLAEPECRAAAMLARRAIDLAAVRRRWPALTTREPLPGGGKEKKLLSRDVEVSLQLARQRLAAFPQPLEMATEHVLLGLADADHEVSVWLRQQGIDPDLLESEILKLYGCQAEPLKFNEEPERESDSEDREKEKGKASNPAADAGAPVVTRQIATLRVLDTAGNRAREGLRVVEDYVRFVLDDRYLTQLCKQLRHDLTDALGRVPAEQRLAARETQADVGTGLSTAAEQHRTDAAEVLAANFARLQEAVRSLEEFGKLFDPILAAVFKQLRYRTYTLQRAVDITRGSIARLAEARLYVLIDGRPSIEEFERLARGLIGVGVHVLQLRDKQLGDRELLERARLLRSLIENVAQPPSAVQKTDTAGGGRATSSSTAGGGRATYEPRRTLMIVNDRPDLAVLAQADGVHMGQEELSVKDARSIVGPDMLVGVSTHSIEQARQAVIDGANYIGVGPTFPSGTKRFEQFPGVELLRRVAAEIRLPAFAIGGIDRQNLAEVLAAGFTRIAVSGAVTAASDAAEAARNLLVRLVPSPSGESEGPLLVSS
jgi:thiamine-phosphate pyrophosphorylase